MRRVTLHGRRLVPAMCACALMVSVAMRAQQAPAPTLVPVAASSLLLHPEPYLNQTVSVYAPVEQVLSATTFSMDQDPKKPSMTDLLIVAPTLTAQPTPGAYMTVVGIVIRFDQAELAKRAKSYTLDLAPNVVERYRGKVMVLATSVIDSGMVDLAKVLPRPMTPEEEALSKVMKQINPAAAELRNAAGASDKAIVSAQATALTTLLGDTKKFFEARGTKDAVDWATEGVTLMASIQKSAAAGQWPDVQASATKLTSLCSSCHTAHRERMEDGTYRVKK